VFGFMVYDLVHFALHHLKVCKSLKRHHMHHHFQATHTNFGVTTTALDYLLHNKA